jgi:predicted Zn-dependent peptidase
VLVASQDDGAPVASLAITVAAGYRHETHATAGVVHYLRNVAFQVRPSLAVAEKLGRDLYASLS